MAVGILSCYCRAGMLSEVVPGVNGGEVKATTVDDREINFAPL